MSIIAVKGLKPLSFTIIDLDNGENMVVTTKGEEAESKEGTRTRKHSYKDGCFHFVGWLILFIHSTCSFGPSESSHLLIRRASNRMTRTVSLSTKDIITNVYRDTYAKKEGGTATSDVIQTSWK